METRRRFLKAAGAGLTGFLAGCASERPIVGTSRTQTRPNILFAIADDWSWPHASIAGARVIRTPTFDRVAGEGVLFTHAFTSSPSCTPSRGAILTGQQFWRLQEGGNLWSTLPAKFDVYPELLERAGYHVGLMKKGWGPGDFKAGGREKNPAGRQYSDFGRFISERREGQPFCFWFGSHDPHRPYDLDSGLLKGLKPAEVEVPACLPDCDAVRRDICDYYLEIQRLDEELGHILSAIERMGELDNTLVAITSDNGMPFPRCKANLYDMGTNMPLAMRWPRRIKRGRRIEDFVSLTDLAPTFLEAAGVPIPEQMSGRSLMPILSSSGSGRAERGRDRVFFGRERHAWVRWGGLGYPCRAVRTDDFLYIRNFEPDRWPAGDPDDTRIYKDGYGDIDAGPAKTYMLEHRDDASVKRLFELAFLKRPAEELYDLRKDPDQLNNVAAESRYAAVRADLAKDLENEMKRTADPRYLGKGQVFDSYPYYGTTVENQPPPLIPGRDR